MFFAVPGDPMVFLPGPEFPAEKQIKKSYTTRSTNGQPRKVITQLVPEFNWEQFKLLPNAKEFVAKHVDKKITQLMREIDENINGTSKDHLTSMEAVVARSLTYTSLEIGNWWDGRDLAKTDIDSIKSSRIRKMLVEFGVGKSGANAENLFDVNIREKLASRVTEVAEKEDSLAGWLFTKLTGNRSEDSLLGDL